MKEKPLARFKGHILYNCTDSNNHYIHKPQVSNQSDIQQKAVARETFKNVVTSQLEPHVAIFMLPPCPKIPGGGLIRHCKSPLLLI